MTDNDLDNPNEVGISKDNPNEVGISMGNPDPDLGASLAPVIPDFDGDSPAAQFLQSLQGDRRPASFFSAWDAEVCRLLSPQNLERAAQNAAPPASVRTRGTPRSWVRGEGLQAFDVTVLPRELPALLQQCRPDGIARIRVPPWADAPQNRGASLDRGTTDSFLDQQGAFPVREDGTVLAPPLLGLGGYWGPRGDLKFRFVGSDGEEIDPGPLRVCLFALPAALARAAPEYPALSALRDPEGREFCALVALGQESGDGRRAVVYRNFRGETLAEQLSPNRVRELRRAWMFPPRRLVEMGFRRMPNPAVLQLLTSDSGHPRSRLFPPAAYSEWDAAPGQLNCGHAEVITSVRALEGEVEVMFIPHAGGPGFRWRGADYRGPPIPAAGDFLGDLMLVGGPARVGGITFNMELHDVLRLGLGGPYRLEAPDGSTWRWTPRPWGLVPEGNPRDGDVCSNDPAREDDGPALKRQCR